MNSSSIDAALKAIEDDRAVLINMVNKKMDALRQRVINGETADGCGHSVNIEREYPLITPPALFKGTKPTAVIFGSEKVSVKKWRTAYTEILKRCISEKENHDAMMSLRNRVYGRKRGLLSDNPAKMNVPVMLSIDLYVEAYFDTEWLIRVLTKQILDAIGYDYSGISIAVVENRRVRR